VKIHGRWSPWIIGCIRLGLGEAYMDGRLTVEDGSIADVLEIIIASGDHVQMPWTIKLARATRHWLRRAAQFNPAPRARKNVAHHYDLSGALFDLFLDADRQYSCAYFDHPKASLEGAQSAKKKHIAAKLKLDKPNLSVLDIGSGCGLGLSCTRLQCRPARRHPVHRTIGRPMHGHTGRCFRTLPLRIGRLSCDQGPFDRIVSVGMFEHVGINHYDTFFAKVRD
jgi:cyclopropane-fatty-acyl-phospholipid synthase